jgi:hypothetical protein
MVGWGQSKILSLLVDDADSDVRSILQETMDEDGGDE